METQANQISVVAFFICGEFFFSKAASVSPGPSDGSQSKNSFPANDRQLRGGGGTGRQKFEINQNKTIGKSRC